MSGEEQNLAMEIKAKQPDVWAVMCRKGWSFDMAQRYLQVQESLVKEPTMKEKLLTLIDIAIEHNNLLIRDHENLEEYVAEIDRMIVEIAEELSKLHQISEDMENWFEAVKTAYKSSQKGIQIEVQPNLNNPENPKYYLHKKK